jgi:hypothetical protein
MRLFVGLIGLVGALTADVLFNRARRSTSIVDLFLSAIGSSAAGAC